MAAVRHRSICRANKIGALANEYGKTRCELSFAHLLHFLFSTGGPKHELDSYYALFRFTGAPGARSGISPIKCLGAITNSEPAGARVTGQRVCRSISEFRARTAYDRRHQ